MKPQGGTVTCEKINAENEVDKEFEEHAIMINKTFDCPQAFRIGYGSQTQCRIKNRSYIKDEKYPF